MASLSAAAIVVSHARPDLLEQSLKALAFQETKAVEVVVVETSSNLQSKELANQFGFQFLGFENATLSEAISAAIEKLVHSSEWLWILHDDCVPESNALGSLLRTAETSPSVAVVGPKLLEASNPQLIQQLGLTTTRSGRPFVLVQEEYDQGQHDRVADVMATSTAGMLVSLGVWQKLEGLNSDAPTLAQDLDFGMRVRTAGYRVIVDPQARVKHHGLSLKGMRSKRWLGGSWSTAISKSENYLATLLLPNWLAALRLVLLPVIAFVSVPIHIYSKKPARIYGEFLSWLWTWVLLPKILRGRRKLRSLGRPNVLKNLYATPAEQKRRRESKLDFVSTPVDAAQPGLIGSGAIWAIVIPLLLSYNWLPTGEALKLGGTIFIAPSFSEWLSTISSNSVAGFNGQPVPMDPFTWVFGLFAVIGFLSPSQALAAFLFLTPALAFAASWKLFAFLNESRLLSTIFALTYSCVALVTRSSGAIYLAVIAVALPLALWALIRALRAETSSRAWRWTGLAGLSLGLVAISSPALFVLIAITGIALSVTNPKRLLLSLVAMAPGLALLIPHFLASSQLTTWLFTFENAGAELSADNRIFYIYLLLGIPLPLLALLGIFRGKPSVVFVSAFFAVGSFVLAFVIPSGANQMMFLLATTLGLSQLAFEFLERISKRWLAALIATPAFLWIAVLGLWSVLGSTPEFTAAKNVPALVEAANATGEEVRTLRVEIQSDRVLAHLIIGNDKQLHESSFIASISELPDPEYQELLSEIAARVAAGSPSQLEELLLEAKLDFVLIAPAENGAEVAAAAGARTMSFLQTAGDTEFGKLFRVSGSDSTKAEQEKPGPWAIWQLGVLAVFALLAIPTPAAVSGTRRKQQIVNGEDS